MRRQRGFTLIELIISVVLVGILAVGALVIVQQTVSRGADPMVRHQAVAIAEAYIEEIRRKHFVDPGDGDGEGARSEFDDIDDYDGLVDNPPRDQAGNDLTGLGDYRVSVTVSSVSEIGVGGGNEARIDVAVDHLPSDELITLSSYRTRHD